MANQRRGRVRRRAVYAGSFDPITNGHMYMIRTGAEMFDELIVAIGINPEKKYTFSLKQRLEFLRKCTSDIANVRLDHFSNMYLFHYAQQIQAAYILRGIRNSHDYEYERAMCYVNTDLNSAIATVFLMPPRELSEISSGFVKGLVGPKDWARVVKDYLPSPIYRHFLEHFQDGKSHGDTGGLKDMPERV
ncbi:MAG: pantetheine-phosphate adenylyltransferase [Planctomycetota bacterium]